MSGSRTPGVYIEGEGSEPPPIRAAPTSIAAIVGCFERGPTDRPIELNNTHDFATQFGGTSQDAATVRSFFENGGQRIYVSRAGESADKLIGSADEQTGLFALDRIDDEDRFQLLMVPTTLSLEAHAAARVIEASARFCHQREAFLIADPPSTLGSVERIVPWYRTLATLSLGEAARNGALYFPALEAEQAESSGPLASSGAVAGIYARTDHDRGVWKAPAGQEARVRGATGVSIRVSERESETLAPIGINPIRELAGVGLVVWGGRTMASQALGSDSEWRYVAVRRTALFLQESLSRGLGWAVFEPNEEPLWTKMRQATHSFLQGLLQEGAFAGETPEEAFFVRVDRTTMTQDDIDRGMVEILVGFAPLKPAEFVVLRLTFGPRDQ